eukprot:gene9331-1418_t
MGVPSFYIWLSQKFPNISMKAYEEGGDLSKPNPNKVEFDNLYLDMNGIIHPCVHPTDKPAPKNEEEMFDAIFKYLDKIFSIVRPRKVIYMALDGVAPRSKQNQQRARRFKSCKDSEKIHEIEEKLAKEHGITKKKNSFDSNVISPGTQFMEKVSQALQYFITSKLTKEKAFKDVKFILSDSNVPGEGEHKVLEFIRTQRSQKGYDPNTKHCMVGLDADLIFLALTTHEPFFYILREQMFNKSKFTLYEFLKIEILREYLRKEFQELPNVERSIDDFVFMCMLVGNDFLPRLPSLDIQEGSIDTLISTYKMNFTKMGGYICDSGEIDLQRFDLFISKIGQMEEFIFQTKLKRDDYRREEKMKNKLESQKKSDEEDIDNEDEDIETEEEIEKPIEIKKEKIVKKTKEEEKPKVVYVTNFPNETTIDELEKYFFKAGNVVGINIKKHKFSDSKYAFVTFSTVLEAEDAVKLKDEIQLNGSTLTIDPVRAKKPRKEKPEAFVGGFPLDVTKEDLAEKFASCGEIETISLPDVDHKGFTFILFKTQEGVENALKLNGTEWKSCTLTINMSYEKKLKSTKYQRDLKKQMRKLQKVNEEDHPDDVRLGDESGEGWRNRYYKRNFKDEKIDNISQSYIEGLCWVSKYYFQGHVSWSWYYKYNYAPFASDLVGCKNNSISFELSKPFNPFTQLLAILPSKSAHALPKSYQTLMTSKDSPIIDFYPDDFEVDLVGKKLDYKGVILLPFIDEKRLLAETEKIESTLTEEEKKRNSIGKNLLFISEINLMVKTLIKNEFTEIDHSLADGFFGSVKPLKSKIDFESPFKIHLSDKYKNIQKNQSIILEYIYPKYEKHICDLLPGVDLKNAELSPNSPFLFSFPLDEFSPVSLEKSPISAISDKTRKNFPSTNGISNSPTTLKSISNSSDLEFRVMELEKELEKEREERLLLENQLNQQDILVNRRLDKMQKIINQLSKSLEE